MGILAECFSKFPSAQKTIGQKISDAGTVNTYTQ